MQTPAKPRKSSHRAAVWLLLASALATGCATAKPKRTDLVWPPPPEKGRIKYVRSFGTPEQLGLSAGRKLLKTFLPTDPNVSLKEPYALAFSPDERRLYVSSGRPTRIVVVDLESSTMSLFADREKQQPALIFGLATDAEENVYVSDRKGQVILVYDKGGHFLRKFGEGRLQTPTAIAVDRRGQLLYVVNGATSKDLDHRIEVYSLKGDHLRTIGTRGDGPGEFNFPGGITIGKDRSLYVVDKLNFRVQVFDADGNVVDQFGVLGRGNAGFFDKIRGLGFDTFGNMYIVDTMQGVHILNPKHQPLMLFGAPPFLEAPNAIVVDARNRIFVSDYGANQVHEFQLVNTTAADSYAEPAAADAAPKTAPAAAQPATGGAPNAAPAAAEPAPKGEPVAPPR